MELDKKEIEQAVYIEANYPQTVSFNLDVICHDKNINKKDIIELQVIKWGMLFIRMRDGKEFEIKGMQSEDWKWSISDTYFDKNYNEILEINN
tara:strand:- start:1306 stop:1584 length:279 start_codon:yes stop_codon:yes gene_type:complete